MSYDAIVTFLSDMLREYKLQNKEWDGSCSSIYRSKEHGDDIVLVHHLGYYHYTGVFPSDKEEKVKACAKHTRRFLAGVRKKGFVISRRQKHTSLGVGDGMTSGGFPCKKTSNSNFFTMTHFLIYEGLSGGGVKSFNTWVQLKRKLWVVA